MKNTFRWKIAQSFEINWWKRYLKNRDVADYAGWKRNYWNSLLEKISDVVHLKKGDRILDAGCGPAGVFMILGDFNTDAVDPLLNEYESKLAHFKKALHPTVNFYSQPFETFNTGNSYDVIFCMNAINHVADLEWCFDKLVQLVKRQGKIVITIDGHNYSFFKKLFRLIPGDVLHPHQFDVNEYEAMLTKRGCVIEKRIQLKGEFFFNHYLLVARKS